MMNFSLNDFVRMMIFLSEEHEWAGIAFAKGDTQLSSDAAMRVIVNLTKASDICRDYGMFRAVSRLERIFAQINAGALNVSKLKAELVILHHAIEDDVREENLYHYPKHKAEAVSQFDQNWGAILSRFEAARDDARGAVDCWALGHNTACVFHLMRVMEIGVQAFGKRLGVALVKSGAHPGKRVSELTWGQILQAINPKLGAMSQRTLMQKRLHAKYAAIQSYLYGVKDAWRNPTMHPRHEGYNELQAHDILNHVRSFMSELTMLFK